MREDTAGGQMDFHLCHTENSLRHYLEECLGKPVSLIFTENSTSMLSARICAGIVRVRLHRMFVNAEDKVLDEVASFLRNKKGKMPHFRSFVRDNREHLRAKPPNKVPVKTQGEFHDLRELQREINQEYFDEAVNAAITWGSGSPRHSVRKRTLGSYSGRSNTIRISPVLDRKTVPRYFISFVVYHEMLHAAMGTPLKGKRRSVHSREFRTRERLFKDYEKALAWERGE